MPKQTVLLRPGVCSVHTQSRSVFCAHTEVVYIRLLRVSLEWVSHSALIKYLISHMLQWVQKCIHKHNPLPWTDPRISEDRLSWQLPPCTLHGLYRLSTLIQNTPVLQRLQVLKHLGYPNHIVFTLNFRFYTPYGDTKFEVSFTRRSKHFLGQSRREMESF